MCKKVITIPAEQVEQATSNKPKVLRVAAYCRVSTDEERQLGSFENQIEYFTNLITDNRNYELVKVYNDEGISGTSIRSRKGFCEMIEDCKAGKIDLIITKSISRFARNTQDSLNYTRMLKEMGIGIIFEKEGISTLESSGELLLTLFSCFAQEESRSISENTSWGIRSKFMQGIPHLNTDIIMGYDKNENGDLIINEEQAVIIRRIYKLYLEGYSLGAIARALNDDDIPGVRGEAKWCGTTISRILANEKYKGALLMQKTFTSNYLTKHQIPNTGQLAQYYIEENHDAIIEPKEWEAVQEETNRRKAFRKQHGLRGLSGSANSPFYSRFFCSKCGNRLQRIYHRGVSLPFWECKTCGTKIDDALLRRSFCKAFNEIVYKRNEYMPIWANMQQNGTPLESYHAQLMMDVTEGGTIPFEIPELTQAILKEALLNEDNSIDFFFHTCSMKIEMIPEQQEVSEKSRMISLSSPYS